MANQRFYILNEKGEETLDWISGDIYIAGKGLAIGYLGDPELTEKKFIYSKQLKERLYKTGDIGRYMPDGTIEFQGRSDFQVKIRGHRVELGEIEMAIVEILHPKDLKVITVNNNDVISICMFAVLENESDALSKEELGKYLSEKIPQYMIPVYCEYLSEIPLTVNGKIDIKVLTSRAIEGMKKSRSRGKSEQKLSETEENIYKVWCELFNTTDISVDEDFFECGGDSILFDSKTGKYQINVNESSAYIYYRNLYRLRIVPSEIQRKMDISCVDKISEAVVKLILSDDSSNDVYHVINPNGLTIKEILNCFKDCENNKDIIMKELSVEEIYNYYKKTDTKEQELFKQLVFECEIVNDIGKCDLNIGVDRTIFILEQLGFKWEKVGREEIIRAYHAIRESKKSGKKQY